MKRVVVGAEGPPDVTIIGAIHGDEPCGVRAIERFLDNDVGSLNETASVQFIIANEKALERDVRYVDTDLNRTFPGDLKSSRHEDRLANRIMQATAATPTMSIHSTHSTREPFCLFDQNDLIAPHVADAMPLKTAIDVDVYDESGFIRCPGVFEVEAGYQKSDAAAENAYELIKCYLRVFGLMDGPVADIETTLYRSTGRVYKDDPSATYEFVAQNFSEVPAGRTYAYRDGDPLVAENAFVPVLMSGEGYPDILGFTGESVGPLTLSGNLSLPRLVSECATL